MQNFRDIHEIRMLIDRRKKAIEVAELALKDALDDFRKEFRAIRREKKTSLRFLAQHLGLSAAYLSDVELGRRNPNDKILNFYK